MNRHELSVYLKIKHPELTTKKIVSILRDAENAIVEAVMNGNDVALLGFGTFRLRNIRAMERTSYLNGGKTKIEVPAKRKIGFTPSKTTETIVPLENE